jgi:hypothetical protein
VAARWIVIGVDIAITITADAAGRLTGVARRVGDQATQPFSGNLELLAAIERLSTGTAEGGLPPYPTPRTAEDD